MTPFEYALFGVAVAIVLGYLIAAVLSGLETVGVR